MGIDAYDHSPISVLTRLRARSGSGSALGELLRAFAETVRREEADCLAYQPLRSIHDAQCFVVFERYRDPKALDAHANSDHLRELMPALMECVEDPPELTLYSEADASAAE